MLLMNFMKSRERETEREIISGTYYLERERIRKKEKRSETLLEIK